MEDNDKLAIMAKQLEEKNAEIKKLKAELDSLKNKRKNHSSRKRSLARYAHMTEEEKDAELEVLVSQIREHLAKERTEKKETDTSGDC